MNRLVQPILLSCRKAGELIEKSQVQKLSWFEKTKLGWHLSLCDACNQYQKQSQILGQLLKKRVEGNFSIASVDLKRFQQKVISKLPES